MLTTATAAVCLMVRGFQVSEMACGDKAYGSRPGTFQTFIGLGEGPHTRNLYHQSCIRKTESAEYLSVIFV